MYPECGESEVELRKHSYWVYSVDFSPNGGLESGFIYNIVHVWNVVTGDHQQNLTSLDMLI